MMVDYFFFAFRKHQDHHPVMELITVAFLLPAMMKQQVYKTTTTMRRQKEYYNNELQIYFHNDMT